MRPPLACVSGDNREILAAWRLAARLGRPFMPLAPDLPSRTRAALMARAGARPGPPGEAPAPATADLPPLLMATSGSEGRPRLISLDTASLAAMAAAANRRLGLGRGDLWLLCLPLYHIGGMAILYRAAWAGAGVLAHPRFDPGRVARDLATHPVSHLSLVPAMLPPLLERSPAPPPRLRRVLVGGGPLDPGLMRRATARGWPLCPSYGLTEAASLVACEPPGEAPWPAGRVGRPLDGMAVRIEEGRLWLRAPQIPSTLERDAEGWFRTGDLARLDEAGRLHILGRADDLLVTGGRNVHPLEVERVLAGFPGIGGVALSARPDPRWGQRLVAVVEGDIDAAALLAWARDRLPPHQRPREVMRIPALPQGRLGKLDRRTLLTWVAAAD